MKPYLLALAVGLLVGVIYGALHVRSPAPPVIALVGLLGILAGEQMPSLFMQVYQRQTQAKSWLSDHVRPHMFGHLPVAQPRGDGHEQTSANQPGDNRTDA